MGEEFGVGLNHSLEETVKQLEEMLIKSNEDTTHQATSPPPRSLWPVAHTHKRSHAVALSHSRSLFSKSPKHDATHSTTPKPSSSRRRHPQHHAIAHAQHHAVAVETPPPSASSVSGFSHSAPLSSVQPTPSTAAPPSLPVSLPPKSTWSPSHRFSDREYIIGRKIWDAGQAYCCVTKGVPCPSMPRHNKPKRVDLYYSSWCIRPSKRKLKV
ncbi:hypothetical protein HN873_006733 [Arachis hypogaea]